MKLYILSKSSPGLGHAIEQTDLPWDRNFEVESLLFLFFQRLVLP